MMPRMRGKRKGVIVIFLLAMLMMTSERILDRFSPARILSLNLGDGNCQWTGSRVLTEDDEVYGTLIASYPASGMRMTWQQIQGLTGINVRDDFFMLHLPKIGLVKTQYPHYEGIWSYADRLDQVILLVRNPRWAIPSYHTLINELGYAHTWEYAYDEIPNVFTRRAPMEDWIRWRDYTFRNEINLWGWHIDFYMENGTKYWFDYDFERNGQAPFRFRNETERPWPKDTHCINDIDCVPKAVIFFENIKDPIKGPTELKKIADVLRGKVGMDDLLEDEAIECIWHENWLNEPDNNNDDRDAGGLPREAYNFTMTQMYGIESKLQEMITKYGSGHWAANQQAIDLVEKFNEYLVDVSAEIADMVANPPPTPAPDANYDLELKEWYNSKGLGDRNAKAKVQGMAIWDLVSHFYDDDDNVS